jgi:hypothetical protein
MVIVKCVLLTSKGNGTKRFGTLMTGGGALALLHSLVVVVDANGDGPCDWLECPTCRRDARFAPPVAVDATGSTQARTGVIRNERTNIMTHNCAIGIDI